MRLTIARIEWLDARSEAGWVDCEAKNIPVLTYGILGPKTDTSQIVYSSYDPQESGYGDRNLIPLGMVKSVTILREDDV
jgi:hypothetical protein